MKSNFIQEIIVALILIAIVIFLLNPFHLWMPTMMLMSIIIALGVVFGVFASFFLREKVTDEREITHRMIAARASFLIGTTALIIGIIVQSFSHNVDIWLVITLVVMILAKIVAREYSDWNL
jgi:hypothetical protein